MIKNISFKILKSSQKSGFAFSTSEGASFLQMVESYFDKAGIHTNIRSDKLNFYKKADNVVKCNLSIVRGIFNIIIFR
jgi:hypothetical protein